MKTENAFGNRSIILFFSNRGTKNVFGNNYCLSFLFFFKTNLAQKVTGKSSFTSQFSF